MHTHHQHTALPGRLARFSMLIGRRCQLQREEEVGKSAQLRYFTRMDESYQFGSFTNSEERRTMMMRGTA